MSDTYIEDVIDNIADKHIGPLTDNKFEGRKILRDILKSLWQPVTNNYVPYENHKTLHIRLFDKSVSSNQCIIGTMVADGDLHLQNRHFTGLDGDAARYWMPLPYFPDDVMIKIDDEDMYHVWELYETSIREWGDSKHKGTKTTHLSYSILGRCENYHKALNKVREKENNSWNDGHKYIILYKNKMLYHTDDSQDMIERVEHDMYINKVERLKYKITALQAELLQIKDGGIKRFENMHEYEEY